MKDQKSQINLQDNFLNKARKEEMAVKLMLISGDSIKGKIIGFDNFVIIIKSAKKDVVIYKHAIAGIFPEGDFTLF